MRHAAKLVLSAALLVAGDLSTAPSFGAEAYCASAANAQAKQVPAHLRARLARAFAVDAGSVGAGAYVRCVGPVLMGCLVGANLNCGKADTRRVSPGATAWCRSHPDAIGVPMSATGHATIYEWSCAAGRAVAGRPTLAVDAQGYVADNWKELR